MKKLMLVLLLGIFLVAANVWAEQGEDVFKSLRCGTCHKPDTGKVNPSLKEMAKAYQGKEGQLLGFLKGEAKSIINVEKAGKMEKYVEKTKALKDEERKALADFILSHLD